MQLSTDLGSLRQTVRQQVYAGLERTTNRHKFCRSVEILAAESRSAGIRRALEMVRKIEPPETGISFMRPYEEGYFAAIEDVIDLLAQEAREV